MVKSNTNNGATMNIDFATARQIITDAIIDALAGADDEIADDLIVEDVMPYAEKGRSGINGTVYLGGVRAAYAHTEIDGTDLGLDWCSSFSV